MLARSAMSLSITMTLRNCVSASAAMRENEKWWNEEAQRGGGTKGICIKAPTDCVRVAVRRSWLYKG